MKEIHDLLPGSRRALFAKYHLGGCSSCAYNELDSLKVVSETNDLDATEVLAHLQVSHENDAKMLIAPAELKTLLDQGGEVLLIDTRTREEHEAVNIAGSDLLTQEKQQELFAKCAADTLIVLYDHEGKQVLDTCAWFHGHKLTGTKGLRGGIDAWSQEVDASVQRYRLELEG